MVAACAHAGDPGAERNLDLALAAQLRQGDLLWLDLEGGSQVGAVHTPASPRVPRKGGLILLHDQGRNPDAPGLMRPLRIGLARAGWESLAVQLPMLSLDPVRPMLATDRKAAMARITAVMTWFKAHDILNLALVGHGLGAAFALDYVETLARQPRKEVTIPPSEPVIAAVALIGVVLPEPYRAELLAGLETLEAPVLDLYGSRDYRVVLEQADSRLAAATRGEKTRYEQYRFPLAGHGFEALQGPLLQRLRGWLARVAPAIKAAAARDDDQEQQP